MARSLVHSGRRRLRRAETHRSLAWVAVFVGTLGCRKASFVSPSRRSTQDSAWIPLVVHVGKSMKGAEARVFLDDTEVTDPMGIIRRRNSGVGGKYDYIATLHLSNLDSGRHDLEVHFERSGGTTKRSTWFDYAPRPCRVEATVTDTDGELISARVVVTDMAGNHINLTGPDAAEADPQGRDDFISSFLVNGGLGHTLLDTGSYRLIATRGIHDEITIAEIECTSGTIEASFTLSEGVPRDPDWLSADFHLHSGLSADSFIPEQIRYESVESSGLDLVVLTDHNYINDPAVPLAQLYANHVAGLPGTEARMGYTDPDDEDDELSYGHLNAFPLSDGESLPETNTEAQPEPQLQAFRERQELDPYEGHTSVILQLNHPRGIQFSADANPESGHAMYDNIGLQADLDFDALEVVNRFSWELYQEVRLDWFSLLNQGFAMTGTGNSDSHALEVEQIGFPVNLVQCPREVQEIDVGCLVDAVQQGRVRVSNGPLVSLSLDMDGVAAGIGDLIAGNEGTATIRVQAASWVPVHEIRLVQGGATVFVTPLEADDRDEVGRLDIEVSTKVTLDSDSWVVAEAGWPIDDDEPEDRNVSLGDYATVANGHVPLGFSNPIYVDADGDGAWQP